MASTSMSLASCSAFVGANHRAAALVSWLNLQSYGTRQNLPNRNRTRRDQEDVQFEDIGRPTRILVEPLDFVHPRHVLPTLTS